MKNILIATGASLIVLFLLNAIGISGFLMMLIMAVTPVFIYSKLTTYQTKPFIMASVAGLVVSFLVYFIFQIFGAMFGLGDAVTLNMAYLSVLVGILISTLIYRQLNVSKDGK
jgi:hypothetical protein